MKKIEIRRWALERVRQNLKCWRRDLEFDFRSIQDDINEGCGLAEDQDELEILRSELVLIRAFFSVCDGIEKEGANDE